MIFSIWILPFILPLFSKPCTATPISITQNPSTSDLQPYAPPSRSTQKRDDDNEIWHLVHYTAGAIIQPTAIGAAVMSDFYSLVLQAATGSWRQREPPRSQLHIAWHRVGMLMFAQGMDHIPWDLVAEYARGMLDWVNNGHVAFTYDGFFLKASGTVFPYGLYVGVRILGEREGLANWLAAGRGGVLDPSLR
ncbi:MAG: hypothetical protein LQ339_006955 [Xanthoria mediterranea]|nr:MAG: hypothetical protein LQ339_006955 [Xanthoria mediterranea]